MATLIHNGSVVAPEFKRYQTLFTQADMNRFCKHIGASERSVREGRWDVSLYRWTHSHWHEEDFERIGE